MIEKLLLKNRILKKIMHIANKFRKNKNKNEEIFFFSRSISALLVKET